MQDNKKFYPLEDNAPAVIYCILATLLRIETLLKPKPKNPVKSKDDGKDSYGEFVRLTPEQYDKLIKKMGKAQTQCLINELNNGIGSKGYKYKSHYHTILSWQNRRDKEVRPVVAEPDERSLL